MNLAVKKASVPTQSVDVIRPPLKRWWTSKKIWSELLNCQLRSEILDFRDAKSVRSSKKKLILANYFLTNFLEKLAKYDAFYTNLWLRVFLVKRYSVFRWHCGRWVWWKTVNQCTRVTILLENRMVVAFRRTVMSRAVRYSVLRRVSSVLMERLCRVLTFLENIKKWTVFWKRK